MLAAAKANGVRLMINWPFTWWPQLRHGIVMAQAGELGQVWQVRYRAAHQGPSNWDVRASSASGSTTRN